MIQAPVHDLLDNLERTADQYERLLRLAREKQRHIARNDIEALEEDLHVEDSLVQSIQSLDAERPLLHEAAADASGRMFGAAIDAPGPRTLEQLEAALPAELRMPIERCRRRLRSTMTELHEVNRMNMALIHSSLELAEGMIRALFAVATDGAAYGPFGVRTNVELEPCSVNAKA